MVATLESGRQRLRPLLDTADMVRLGADVTEIGAIGPERAQRAIVAIRKQLELASNHGAAVTLAIATEGVRRAANASAFLDRVQAETGLRFALISGEQEASLAYWGTTSESPDVNGQRGVIDLGGGSLELVVGQGDTVRWRASMPLGAGIVRASLLPSDPPTFREVVGAYDALRNELNSRTIPLPVVDVTVSGGTATALATVAGRAFHKHAERRSAVATELATAVRGQRRALTIATLDALIRLLIRYDTEELSRRYRVKPARAPLLIAGALTLLAGMERFGVEQLWISHRGIREGALVAWQRVGEAWLDAAQAGSLESL